MTCNLAREKLATYLENSLVGREREAFHHHLLDCPDCHSDYEYQTRLNSPLRELPEVAPPPDLRTAIRLKVLTKEPSFWQRWEVHLSNLMRPVALPAAGGLLSAMILFVVLIPVCLPRVVMPLSGDVPTLLVTEPRFKEASPFPVPEDVLIEAWIDERGNITNFEVLNGGPDSPAIEKMLRLQSVTTKFEPATRFGQPTAGKVYLSLRRIDIRG